MSDNTTAENAQLYAQAEETFRATMPDIRPFTNILRGVCFHPTNQRATMTVNSAGLIIYVEEARTMRIAAYIRRELFEEFEFHAGVTEEEDGQDDSNITLSLQLSTLIECLNIFGTATSSASSGNNFSRQPWQRENSDNEGQAVVDGRHGGRNSRNQTRANGRIDSFFPRSDGKGTSMRISYAGLGHPLVLLLAENSGGPTTTCELVTYDAEEQFDMPIDNQNIVLKCILKSSWLRDALSELDPSSEKIIFIGNPPLPTAQGGVNRPHLRIRVPTPLGEVEMDYPNDREVLETFECAGNVSFSYRLSHILRTTKAMQTSTKTSIRIDAEGVLGLQFLSTSTSPRTGTLVENFIDFRCLSIDEER